MIKFWTHRYEMTPWNVIGAVTGNQPRQGALLKVEWPNNLVGYADLFPWPEYNDNSIEDHIEALARGQLSTLVEQAIWLAKKDAKLRQAKKNAFAGAANIKNHYLVSDFSKFTDANMKEVRELGYTTLKVKVGRAIEDEAKFITRTVKQNPVMIRLDFNGKTSFSEFEKFISLLAPSEKAKIEFVEDPMPWNFEEWTEAAKLATLALDHESERMDFEKFQMRPPFTVVVIKPARIDVEKTLKFVNKFALKMVVTSSLDHPVGVAHACLQAIEIKKFYPNTLLDCGCLTHRFYKPNEFSARIQTNGPFLKEIPGTGIGFDSLLETIEWTPVRK